jgi:hypothetical protein
VVLASRSPRNPTTGPRMRMLLVCIITGQSCCENPPPAIRRVRHCDTVLASPGYHDTVTFPGECFGHRLKVTIVKQDNIYNTATAADQPRRHSLYSRRSTVLALTQMRRHRPFINRPRFSFASSEQTVVFTTNFDGIRRYRTRGGCCSVITSLGRWSNTRADLIDALRGRHGENRESGKV